MNNNTLFTTEIDFHGKYYHCSLVTTNAPGIQEKLGIMNSGEVYAVFSYEAQQSDELSFEVNDQLIILRKGDDAEREWWWARMKSTGSEGYVPRNLLGVSKLNLFLAWLLITIKNLLPKFSFQ